MERLVLVTGDAATRLLAKPSIDYLVSHPQADGTLGPPGISGMYWPHAVVFRALQAEFASTGNSAITSDLLRHYLARPGDYGHSRDVTNVEHLLTVYAAAGDARMLAQAKRTYLSATRPDVVMIHLTGAQHIAQPLPAAQG